MNGADFKLDGYKNIITIFSKMPEDGYRKPIVAAFRKAAVPVRRKMIDNLPASLKALKKVIKIVAGKGKSMTLAVGAFGRQGVYRNSKGKLWDPYMLLYWSNYGTLSERSPIHNFQYARRKGTASFKGGIRAGLFFEKAVDESMPEAQKTFESTYLTEHTKFLEKEAAK